MTQPVRNLNLHVQYSDLTTVIQPKIFPALQQAYVQAVRIDIDWANWSKTQGAAPNPTYLARFDWLLQACANAGIKVLVTCSYSPAWASSGPNGEPNAPPANPADYAVFCEQIVRRYGSQIEAWEVWNEPDLGYSWDTTLGTVAQRAAAYAQLLKATYPVLKQANPSLLVCAAVDGYTTWAGKVPNGVTWDWFQGFFAADPQGYYDRISSHMYADPPSHANTQAGSPSPFAGSDLVSWWQGYHEPTLQGSDPYTPVWITEAGWNTGTNGVTTVQQAANLTAVYAAARSSIPNLERAPYWYSLQDDNSGAYGLFDANWNPKPALAAFQALA